MQTSHMQGRDRKWTPKPEVWGKCAKHYTTVLLHVCVCVSNYIIYFQNLISKMDIGDVFIVYTPDLLLDLNSNARTTEP